LKLKNPTPSPSPSLESKGLKEVSEVFHLRVNEGKVIAL